MVVPVSLSPGRHDPRSPYYEPSEEEQKRQAEQERQEALMEEHRLEQAMEHKRKLDEAKAVAGPEGDADE